MVAKKTSYRRCKSAGGGRYSTFTDKELEEFRKKRELYERKKSMGLYDEVPEHKKIAIKRRRIIDKIIRFFTVV